MFNNIIIPSKIGDSYLFSKRIVSFDITKFAVHAILIVCKADRVVIQNRMSIVLKDYSTASVIGAIKKIISTIGKYDEVVTSIASGSVVYKELQLPFIGYEKLEMVIPYEVEVLLPFALDVAVIDFIVTNEDKEKNISTVLVAAALKQDVDAQYSLFEKAGVLLHSIGVDMFALYALYKHALYKKAPVLKKSLWFFQRWKKSGSLKEKQVVEHSEINDLLVDIDFESTRIMYVSSGIVKSIRVLSYGVADIAQEIGKNFEISPYDVAQQIVDKDHMQEYNSDVKLELQKLFDHIEKTMIFFENNLKANYKKPQKIIFLGLGCSLYDFNDVAQSFFNVSISVPDIDTVFKALHVTTVSSKKKFFVDGLTNLSVALLDKYNDTCNLLKSYAEKSDNALLYKQLIVLIMLTVGCVGGLFWHSSSELQRWNKAYISSKKELTTTIGQIMEIDLKSERNLNDIVTRAEEKLKKERSLWFSFSKETEQSYLEFLQDLSVKIDRESIGLDLKKLSMNPEMVTLVGTMKDEKELLEVFEEELTELKLLQLIERPSFLFELGKVSFTVRLKVKDKGQHDKN